MLTIQNGAIGSDDDGGGGALLQNSNAVIVDCIFKDNNAVYYGAGVSIRGSGVSR